MIILDPPPIPANVVVSSDGPEHQAVEMVLQLLGARYASAQTVGGIEWMRCIRRHDADVSFVLDAPTGEIPVEVFTKKDQDRAVGPHSVYKGAEGLLELMATLRPLV